jgi:hypothetical protein
MHSFDAGNFAGKQGKDSIGMPGSDPSGETGIMKMADNAAAEKSGAAKHGHARRHDAKVSRQLRLSHSHSPGGQSRHRAGASQKALVSRQGLTSVDTSSIESTSQRTCASRAHSFQRPAGVLFILKSDRGGLLRHRHPYGVELCVALFDAASPLVPGNGGTDMIRASALACSGDFLLRLAGCQSKNPIAQI